jgi:hypothetical protein
VHGGSTDEAESNETVWILLAEEGLTRREISLFDDLKRIDYRREAVPNLACVVALEVCSCWQFLLQCSAIASCHAALWIESTTGRAWDN